MTETALAEATQTTQRVKLRREPKVKVPEHLIFNRLPDNIQSFLQDLLPNMQIFALSRLKRHDLVEICVADFMLYLLDNDSEGLPRWKRYNPTQHSDNPYFKWVITNLSFFCTTIFNRETREENRRTTMYTLVEQSDDFETQRGTISLDREGFADPEDLSTSLTLKFIAEELIRLASTPAALKDPAKSFEANAFPLFVTLMDEVKLKDMATEFGVSTDRIKMWRRRLTAFVSPML